jgi:hypothetical protein
MNSRQVNEGNKFRHCEGGTTEAIRRLSIVNYRLPPSFFRAFHIYINKNNISNKIGVRKWKQKNTSIAAMQN